MKKFSKVIFLTLFAALILGSFQPVFGEAITDILNPTSIRNSDYKFHLQVIIRDIDGKLISVTESTHGYYIPHDVTNDAFDNHFGKKEIVSIDNIRYEKVQYRESYSLNLPGKLMFTIPTVLEVKIGSEITIVDANIFQAFVPFVYLDEDNLINTQWTIFRELD